MDRKASPWGIVLSVVLLLIPPAGYVAAYRWRLQGTEFVFTTVTNRDGSASGFFVVRFPSAFENRVFWPAAWIHQRLDPQSFTAAAERNTPDSSKIQRQGGTL